MVTPLAMTTTQPHLRATTLTIFSFVTSRMCSHACPALPPSTLTSAPPTNRSKKSSVSFLRSCALWPLAAPIKARVASYPRRTWRTGDCIWLSLGSVVGCSFWGFWCRWPALGWMSRLLILLRWNTWRSFRWSPGVNRARGMLMERWWAIVDLKLGYAGVSLTCFLKVSIPGDFFYCLFFYSLESWLVIVHYNYTCIAQVVRQNGGA